jgi:hypothetical protein
MATSVMKNGINYSWSNISCILFGNVVVGISKLEYNEKQTKENNYGFGDKPISRGYGNYEYSGSMELYLDEWKKIIAGSPDRSPLNIPPFEITVLFGGSRVVFSKDVLQYVEFLENPLDANQGDSKLMVKIPLIIGNISR